MPVYVVGSINVDMVAFCARLPRIGETVRGHAFERHPGGKGANQAVAAARAGAVARMAGATGRDLEGEYMRGALTGYGVDIQAVATLDAATGTALILVGGGDNQIAVVPGANAQVLPAQADALNFHPGDICLAQMEIPAETVRAAFARARSQQALTLFNPAPALPEARALFPLADWIVVNETECAAFSGITPDGTEAAARAAARSLGLEAKQTLVMTLGAEGVLAICGERCLAVPGHVVEVVDTTGAGDCFCGYLAAGLARGEALEAALREANAAAALAVQVKGAASSIPERAAVLRFLAKHGAALPA
jgi:ribokinase